MSAHNTPIVDRLKNHSKLGKNGCVVWMGCKVNGYGQMTVNKRSEYVHKLAWEERNGPTPPGMWVLHTCDNRRCINPDHLFLGTHLDNMRDKEAKGRGNHPKGEQNGTAKLTERKVKEARQLHQRGIPYTRLARRFGVALVTIWLAVNEKTWKHI